MQQTSRKFAFITLILVITLAGCVPSTSVRESTQSALETDPALTQAAQLEQIEEFQRAAEIYQEAANRYPPPDGTKLLLRAIENYIKVQNSEYAAGLLAKVDTRNLPQLDFHRQLLVAELSLAKNRPDNALSFLSTTPTAQMPPHLQEKYHQLRAEGFRLTGNLLESAKELSELDLLLMDESKRLENQLLIIQTLATLTDTALELLQPSPPGIQGGWMELARIIKSQSGDSPQIKALLEKWREQFPSHPALPSLLDGYFKKLKAQFRRPDHIAIMLPSSGPYATAAKALRDGFMAAYYEESSDRRPTLIFYDSSNSSEIWPLFQDAVEAGAEMVIGPLSKDAVSQLARAGELDIPVLALNQVPPEVTPPNQLYQFSLSPEDEAAQAAERAWLDGHENAIVLTPKGNWGNRIHRAFTQRWERLGGKLIEQQSYDAKQHDFGPSIQALLNIDESKERKSDLQRLLGKRLEFEPRRRQDATFIFLAAKPQKARQIRPQLQFHHASDMPIYGTSHIYTGHPDPKKDQDLEGIKFPDIPWLLTTGNEPLSQQAVAGALGSRKLRYPRLYAMGIDSFQLLPHLARLQSSTRESFDGQTGTLYLDGIQQLHRQLVWAEIDQGTPKVLGYAPRLDSGISDLMEQAPQADLAPVIDRTAENTNTENPDEGNKPKTE